MPAVSIYTGGVLTNADSSARHAMMLEVAGYHGRLNAANIRPEQVPHLRSRGAGQTAIERELSWWFEEARLAAPTPGRLDTLRVAHDRLIAAQPDAYSPRLVHGDAQFANHMFDGARLSAVLDWELAFLGHNESDLALIVLFADALNPAESPVSGVPSEEEFIAAYESSAGRSVANWEYFKAFNLLKVATAMVFGAETMPGADELFTHYNALLQEALDAAHA